MTSPSLPSSFGWAPSGNHVSDWRLWYVERLFFLFRSHDLRRPKNMTLKLKPSPSPPASPFKWDIPPPSPPTHEPSDRPPSPPTSWLSARDMKVFGAEPLAQEIGIVKCKDCLKPVLRSAILEHAGVLYASCSMTGTVLHECQTIVSRYEMAGRKVPRGRRQMLRVCH